MTSREMQGKVVSDKMNKTVVVEVKKLTKHPKYNKIVERTKKYKVHDELNRCCTGDIVRIRETRPISKTKRWIVSKILSSLDNQKEIYPHECSLDINAYFPDKVFCKERNQLKIDIKLSNNQPDDYSYIEKIASLSGTKIDAIITVSPENFNIHDPYFRETKTVNITSYKPSSFIEFSLISKKEFDRTEIGVEFFQDSRYLGELKLKTTSIVRKKS
jgi:small subunit ribosomal protein S17